MKEIDNFYLHLDEPNRSCLLALRSCILALDDEIEETLKWSLPSFCYKKKMFCFLSIDAKMDVPYLLVVEGARIDHPMLVANGRKRMKSMSFDANADLPLEVVEEILHEALDLYRSGVIKTK